MKLCVKDNFICLLRPNLYKLVCWLDCHIQRTKTGKYRNACAKHIKYFSIKI